MAKAPIEIKAAVSFTGMVSSVRTALGGGLRLTIDIPEGLSLNEKASILNLYLKNCEVAIVLLPE